MVWDAAKADLIVVRVQHRVMGRTPRQNRRSRRAQQPGPLALLKRAAQEWSADKAPKTAAALAYCTLFALGPVLVLAVALAGLVWGTAPARAAVTAQFAALLGAQAGQAVDALMAAATRPGTTVWAVVGGGAALLVGAAGAFAQLREGLNAAWEVEAKTVSGFWPKVRQAVRRNFLGFAGALGFGFLLLVGLVGSAAVAALGQRIGGAFAGADVVVPGLDFVLGLLLASVAFTLMFRLLPEAKVATRDAAAGGLATGALFVLGQTAMGLYLGRAATASKYGAAGAVPILLLWLYYSCLILLYGAELTQVLANTYGSRIRVRPTAMTLQEAVRQRHGAPSREGAGPRPRPARSGPPAHDVRAPRASTRR